MTDTPLDELGPVDYVIVEFPAGAKNFTGEMAAELVKLVEAGTIRIIDVLILDKNEDGSVDATELSDIEELGELQAIEAELAELLAAFHRRLVGLVEAILSARGKDRGDAVAETLVASFDGVLLGAASRPTSQRRPFVRQSMAVLMGGLG